MNAIITQAATIAARHQPQFKRGKTGGTAKQKDYATRIYMDTATKQIITSALKRGWDVAEQELVADLAEFDRSAAKLLDRWSKRDNLSLDQYLEMRIAKMAKHNIPTVI